jgi:hypothetical protein
MPRFGVRVVVSVVIDAEDEYSAGAKVETAIRGAKGLNVEDVDVTEVDKTDET